MSELEAVVHFELFLWALFSLAILTTFIVMLVRRPSEIEEEKFEKREW